MQTDLKNRRWEKLQTTVVGEILRPYFVARPFEDLAKYLRGRYEQNLPAYESRQPFESD